MSEHTVSVEMRPEYGFTCPECGRGWFSVLLDFHSGQSCGPWYCDECGYGWMVKVADPAETVQLTPAHDRIERTTVTLRSELPFTMTVEGMRFVSEAEPETDQEYADHSRYFYEEHTCPTNIFLNVAAVVTDDGDDDPHGLFRWVSVAPGRPTRHGDRGDKSAQVRPPGVEPGT